MINIISIKKENDITSSFSVLYINYIKTAGNNQIFNNDNGTHRLINLNFKSYVIILNKRSTKKKNTLV